MSETSGTVRKAVAAGGLLVAACVACCAPLIVTPLAALVAAGGLGLALVGQIGLGVIALGGVGAYVFLRRRASSAKKPDCGCGSASGCGSSNTDVAALPDRHGSPDLRRGGCGATLT